jgi:hypothetical protein
MPGMEARAPERTETRSGCALAAEQFAHRRAPLGRPRAEGINPRGHRFTSPPSPFDLGKIRDLI